MRKCCRRTGCRRLQLCAQRTARDAARRPVEIRTLVPIRPDRNLLCDSLLDPQQGFPCLAKAVCGPRWATRLGSQHELGVSVPNWNWLDFDVAEPASRQDTIDLALANIRDHALPFFDLFRDPAALAQELTIRRHPGFFLEQQAVEFVAWTLGTEAAEQCVATHLDALAQCNGEALDLFRQGRDDKPHAQANVAVFLGQCARRLGLGANL